MRENIRILLSGIALTCVLILMGILAFKVSYILYRRVIYVSFIKLKGFEILATYYTPRGVSFTRPTYDYRIFLLIIILSLISLLLIERRIHDKWSNIRRILLVSGILLIIPSLAIPRLSTVQQVIELSCIIAYEALINNSGIYCRIINIFRSLIIPFAVTYIIYIVLAVFKLFCLASVFSTLEDFSIFFAIIFLISSICRLISRGRLRSIDLEVLRRPRVILVLALFLAFILAILPMLPFLNKYLVPIPVDAYYYFHWLVQMEHHGGIVYAFVTDLGLRPLYLTFLYLIHLMGISIWAIASYHIVPLLLFLVVASFISVKRIYKNRSIAALAALLCPLSIVFMVFLYGGFHANLLALSILLIASSLLLSSDIGSLRSPAFVISLILYTLVLLIHPWTWVQFIAAVLTLLIYLYVARRGLEMRRFLIYFISFEAIAALVRFLYHIKSFRSVAMPVIYPMTTSYSISIMHIIWYQLNFLVWGVAAFSLFYVLAICGVYDKCLIGLEFDIFDALLLVSIFPFFTQPLRIILNTVPYIYVSFEFYNYIRMLRSGNRSIVPYLVFGFIGILAYSFYCSIMSVPTTTRVPWNIPKTI